MVSRRKSKGEEEKVATRGRRGLPLPTSRIPEMQIRPNYRRIVNPFCGDLPIPRGRGEGEGKGERQRDGTRQDRERRRKRDSTRNRLV